jgi:hypothetical protein
MDVDDFDVVLTDFNPSPQRLGSNQERDCSSGAAAEALSSNWQTLDHFPEVNFHIFVL